MCDPNLLSHTKSILTYLINSTPGCKSIIKLNEDFFNYVGTQIPYYELGYRFLETFLQSIPDTLTFNSYTKQVYPAQNCSQSQPWLFPVPYINPNQAYNQLMPVQSAAFWQRPLPWINVSRAPNGNASFSQQTNRYAESTVNYSQHNYRRKSIKPVKITISSVEDDDNAARSGQTRNVTISSFEETTSDKRILSPRRNGDGKCHSPDTSCKKRENIVVVTQQTSITQSKNVVTFATDISNELELNSGMDGKIKSLISPDFSRDKYVHSNDYVPPVVTENVPPTMTQSTENSVSMVCKSSESFVEMDSKTPVQSDSLHFIDSEMPPAYTEKYSIDFVSSEPEKGADGGYDSDSSDDLPKKSQLMHGMLSGDNAVPFLPDNDPIQLIGSKFTNSRYGTEYKTMKIESKMEAGGFYELYISEIYSPSKFWFQLVDSEDSCQLEDLEEQLNSFYNSTSTYHCQDAIETRHMIKGYPCAALFDQQWHRAEFLEKPEGSTVRLFFVDYGTVAEVSIDDIRYILSCFCKLPRLCFRGTLDFIKPVSNRWSREATHYFCDIIFNEKLIAGVSEINTENDSARIYVMDSSKHININVRLVIDGYAYPEDPRERYEINAAEALPSFQSLEKGDFPSFQELGKLLDEGFDAEKAFELNVIEEFDCYIPQYMSSEEAFEVIEKYYKKKEIAKEVASKRDATMFLEFFGYMLNNPFLNGMSKRIRVEEIVEISPKNPFLIDFDTLAS